MQLRNAVSVLVVLLAVGAIVAQGHAAATLAADVDVVEQTCEAGTVTALTLRIDAAEPVVVTPHVWSAKQHVQFAWQPSTIRVTGTETVRIRAPDPRAYIQSDRAQVWIADGQRRAIANFAVHCSVPL